MLVFDIVKIRITGCFAYQSTFLHLCITTGILRTESLIRMRFAMSSESGCGDFCIVECSIAVFYQYIYLFYLCVTTGKIGIKFGMHSWDLLGIVIKE